ncbi:hypothetical protein [Aeromonas jandaei]|uniref:hypothetical protein n=1 Tax=Aeromonas jandaei TaxID=650 RepID=UPI001ADD6A26|nr:hypothetical protein [Aeromonas jandaei]QTL93352.1 hypothetical protein AjGTCBM29_01197 [Aeromonas jandaei]
MSKADRNKRYYEKNQERILENQRKTYTENTALKNFAQWEADNDAALRAGNKIAFDRITTETVNKLGVNRVDFVKGYSKFMFSKIVTEQTSMPELYQNKVLWSLFMRFLAKLEEFQDERVKKALESYTEDLGLSNKQRIEKYQSRLDSYKKK